MEMRMMFSLIRAKFSAATWHLLASLTVIAIFFAYVMLHLYPGYLFQIENVWQGLKILIPVDVILGPLLTFAVYAPAKKNLKSDLTIIALCQLIALGYGTLSIYRMRPSVIAFAVDRFNVVTHKALKDRKIPWDRLHQHSYPLLVFAKRPESFDLKSLEKNAHFENNPDTYHPLDDYRSQLFAKTFDLASYKPKNAQQQSLKSTYLAKPEKIRHNQALFIIQGSSFKVALVVLNKKTLTIQDYIAINPWL